MKEDKAEMKVKEKVMPVEKEQGPIMNAGSEPPENFGHMSAKSEGVSKSIPPEA